MEELSESLHLFSSLLAQLWPGRLNLSGPPGANGEQCLIMWNPARFLFPDSQPWGNVWSQQNYWELEAGVSPPVACPLPSVIPPKIVPYQLRLFLFVEQGLFCRSLLWTLSIVVSAASKGPATFQVKEGNSFWGQAPFFLSQSNVTQGHTDVHFCTRGLHALPLLSLLDLGSRNRVP